jgi:hypothetical protein
MRLDSDRRAHLPTDRLPPPDPNRQGNRGGASSEPRVGDSQLLSRHQAIAGRRRLGDWLIDRPGCWRNSSGGGDRRRFDDRRLRQGIAAGRQRLVGGRRWFLSRHLGRPGSHIRCAGGHRLLRSLGSASRQGRLGGLGFAGGEAAWRVGPGVGDPVVAIQLASWSSDSSRSAGIEGAPSTRALAKGTRTVSPSSLALTRGTKVGAGPVAPASSSAHSGWLVTLSR